VSNLDSAKLGIKGEYNWSDEAQRWAIRSNAIVEHDDLDHTLSGSHQRTTAGLGIQADRKWSALTATLGLRGDAVSDFDINPGCSGGVSYAVSDHWLVRANTGYTVNIPTFGQLYQPSHGSIDQARGNPDLDKEKVWSNDITLEFRKGKAHLLQFSVFRSDTWDTILYRRDDDMIFRPVNGDRSWRHGLEATWKTEFKTGLTVDANVILQDSRIDETGKQLVYTPDLKMKLTLQYRLESTGTRLETTLRYSSEQYSELDNREEERLDDYVTVDVKAVQPFKIKTIAADWFLTVENLFDADFQVHFGYPDDGIRLVTGLNLTF
jgi:iron complex outermembrane receptor protein